jgi:hypothetical protein
MGNLITDSIRDKAKTDIAFLNAGSIRGNGIAVGNVTLSDLIDVNPFQNTIATFSLRGSVIPAVLINAVSRAENYTNSGTGRFLQVVRVGFFFWFFFHVLIAPPLLPFSRNNTVWLEILLEPCFRARQPCALRKGS